MGYAVAIIISVIISTAITIPWVNAIDKCMKDPEWQKHKDDPDYWEWPLGSTGGSSRIKKIRRELSL